MRYSPADGYYANRITGFDAPFTTFLRVNSANDLRQLNAHRYYLVVLIPLRFWFGSAVAVELRAAVGAIHVEPGPIQLNSYP